MKSALFQPVTLLKRASRPALTSFCRFNSNVAGGAAHKASSSSSSSATPSATSSNTDTTKDSKSKLQEHLGKVINAAGPIPLGAYMRQCLTSPEGGYYTNKDPFGVSGDFITSPEISQMFGELVGIWVLTQWMAQGCPSRFRIVEYGPGRGTLMDDFLRSTSNFSDFTRSLYDVHLVEASSTLSEVQRKQLCGSRGFSQTQTGQRSTTKHNVPIYWHEVTSDVPDNMPTFAIAHEFFDALPIYQFENTEKGWRELLVDYSVPQVEPGKTSSQNQEPTFHMTRAPAETPSSKLVPANERFANLPVGSKIEVSPESWDVAADLGRRVEKNGGAALVIDYGSSTIPAESLRGIKGHKIVSPFENPGEADLSADVDFTAVKNAASKDRQVDVHGPATQGDFLHSLGIGARATQLANNQTSDDGKKRVEQAYNRLVEKGGGAMGKVYKVMCIVPGKSLVPVGFGGSVPDS